MNWTATGDAGGTGAGASAAGSGSGSAEKKGSSSRAGVPNGRASATAGVTAADTGGNATGAGGAAAGAAAGLSLRASRSRHLELDGPRALRVGHARPQGDRARAGVARQHALSEAAAPEARPTALAQRLAAAHGAQYDDATRSGQEAAARYGASRVQVESH